jgi:protein kinase A
MLKKIQQKMAGSKANSGNSSNPLNEIAAFNAISEEPKMLLSVGNRRNSSSVDSYKSAKTTDTSAVVAGGAAVAGDEGGRGPNGTGLPRRQSTKRTLSVIEASSPAIIDYMQNIYSSPLSTTIHYTPPTYPKTPSDERFITLSIQRNFVFANAINLITDAEESCRQRELQQIVDAFELVVIQRVGEVILRGDCVGDYFYILKEGIVEYRVEDGGKEVGGYRTIGRAKKPGQSFGELCLLYDCPPPADCVSATNTHNGGDSVTKLWRIHKMAFRQIMALRTMRRDEQMRNAIRKICAFEGLDDEYVFRISDALETRVVNRGEVLYKIGDVANDFFVMGADGQVKLMGMTKKSGSSRSGSSTVILGAGDVFGEEAIIDGGGDGVPSRRNYTATVMQQTTLFTMSRQNLDRTIGSLKDSIQLSRDRKLLKSISLLRDSDLEDFEYELLAALIETAHFKAGQFVYEEGKKIEEPALFFVRDGIFEGYSPDDERVYRKGGYFGEDSLTPDEKFKFAGAKGGTKFYVESVETLSDTAVCGKLTLANIDSVILDLHRLGCKRRGRVAYSSSIRKQDSDVGEAPPAALDELEFHALFGAGTFGKVWIVSKIGVGDYSYALKIQSKRELIDHRQASSATREREVMSKLDHPFVCKLVNTFQDDECIYMLQSLVQGGELLNLIQGGQKYGGMPEIATKFYAAAILEGVTYLHRRHIVYRDLKPENILLDSSGYPVIIDFGFAKVVSHKTYTFCGTPLYLAPEIVLQRGHDRGVDYWSLGCLIYEMLFGRTPFHRKGIDQKGLLKNIVGGKWSVPEWNAAVSNEAIDLIAGMLKRRSTERLGCLAGGYRDIKAHPWMKEVNFNKLVKKQIRAPWLPSIEDAFDISNFEEYDNNCSDYKDFTRSKKPLTADEQVVFRDF